ncbi:MAG: histidine phosphatase family protein [Gammaproteobacteria bacterium]|nr:histidine phosphatase family protein [Gammaproteobacteria bacterium]
MKTLLILRHAKSSWKETGLADHDRSLNKRGRRDAPRIGDLLREEGLVPDIILGSSAKRAKRTAEIVAEESGFGGDIMFSRELYAAWPVSYIDVLNIQPDHYGCVMVVGHNPGLEELLLVLTGEAERMPTAALAQVTLPIDSWCELSYETSGELVEIWRPREL